MNAVQKLSPAYTVVIVKNDNKENCTPYIFNMAERLQPKPRHDRARVFKDITAKFVAPKNDKVLRPCQAS